MEAISTFEKERQYNLGGNKAIDEEDIDSEDDEADI